MTRMLGPSGSRRRRRSLLGALVSFLLVSLFILPNAFAVHDEGVFQLDGNAKKSDTTGAIDADPGAGVDYGDDWDNVCREVIGDVNGPTTCGTNVVTDGATAVAWVSEPDRSASIFTGGGSKDPQDVSAWLWKNAGGLPDKDNLRHAFAARYSTATKELLYFGSDRFDNSGDAQQGFWFLQAPLAADGPSSQGGFKFTDGSGGTPAHTPGDLLVISDFSIGGAVSTINIYEWVASGGDTTTHLDFVDGGTGRICQASLHNDEFCGIVNPVSQSPTASPWAFLDKSNSTSFLNGEFFEAGIDLTGLGFGDECFSTVVSETRASTSPTATLKDFVVGGFGQCGSTIVTTPSDGSGVALTDSDNDGVPDTSITTAGSISVTDSAKVTVSGVKTWNGSVAFSLCKLDTGTCTADGTSIGSVDVDNTGPDPVVSAAAEVTAAGRYCWRADFTSTTNGVPDKTDDTAGECFIVNPVRPALTTQAGTSPVDLGTAVTDTATLSGTANKPGTPVIEPTTAGGAATGTITFTLYKADCTTPATGTGTNPQTLSVTNGDNGGVAYGPVSFTPDAPGVYHWVATYGGDSPNTLASDPNADDATCGTDPNEDVTVRQVSTEIKTKQGWFPNDTATITSSLAGDNLGAGGSVVFSLYDTPDCSGTALYTETKTLTGGAHSEEVSTDNQKFEVTTDYTDAADSIAGPYSWAVVYTPTQTDTGHTGTQSACDAEHFSITYTNDAGP